ncbi:CTD small phosphatase-like protein [Rhynchospora pubera]|uniref:CTD small phosphatase-like protein n=1 Tax=Rhynchospora pubera TaxID=906938 RepID=A0AAV8CDH8_9POAL|nr:CTD small phosphatase-like protein [Rhynchospora pubera]
MENATLQSALIQDADSDCCILDIHKFVVTRIMVIVTSSISYLGWLLHKFWLVIRSIRVSSTHPSLLPISKFPDSSQPSSPVVRNCFSPLAQKQVNLLPPTHKKTLFLDLDNTLITTKSQSPPKRYDLRMRKETKGGTKWYYVIKRPGVDELFRAAVDFDFEIVIFTAGSRDYASPILDWLDPNKEFISHRLYRDSCTMIGNGRLIKNITTTGRRLDLSVFVDDNPMSFVRPLDNAIAVRPFFGDCQDVVLHNLVEFFEFQRKYSDIRSAVKQYKAIKSEEEELVWEC